MRRLIGFLRPYRAFVVVDVVLLFLNALATLYLPKLMSTIVDRGVVRGDIPYILRVGGLMLAVALLSAAASVVAGYFSAKAMAHFGHDLRARVFQHVEAFAPHEFDRLGTSSLIVRTTNDVIQVQQFVNMLLRMMVRAPLMMIGGIVMAVDTDAKLSLVFVVIMPLLAAVILLVMRRGVRLFQEVQRRVDVFNRVVRENLAGVRVVRAFDRTDDETERLLHANQDLTLVSTQVFRLMATLMPLLMLIINGSTIAILWFGGQGVRTGAVEVGNLMAFIQYATQIMMSIMMVSMMFFMWPRAEVSAGRINEVLDIVPGVADPPRPLTPGSTRGEVAFTGVSFCYPGADATVLEDITFRCRRGEWTAIVGGIGSGKSTLVSLLLRFFDVTAGTITVDGVDVRALDQATLRQKIGFVPQRSVLFSGTVAENIRFGAPTASDADVRRAAEIAQAVEFIEALPEGYDTRLSQGGTNLSGGQRQRLAIARALVRRPEIYVFDESFSALDYRTDALLRAALRREIGDATVIVVTQRVSTALDADQIVVLDEGRIAGIGTHASLLESCEVYREIVASQMEKEATA